MLSIGYKVNPVTNVPTSLSKAEEWVQWHKELNRLFGKRTANSLFMLAWTKRGSTAVTTYNMRQYMRDHGIIINESGLDKLTDTGADIVDYIWDIAKLGKWSTAALLFVIVAGIGYGIYNVAKNPRATAKSVSNAKKMKV